MGYIASKNLPEVDVGAYSYKLHGSPILYASCYAALAKHLYGDLDLITKSERANWITYIQKHQSDDGLFRDILIECPEATMMDSWGWRHLTLHALMALTVLGGTANKKLSIIDFFRKPGAISEWLERRNWDQNAANVSNEVQNYATVLQYARDFQMECWCDDALNEMYGWLDRHQNSKTGCWGYKGDTPLELSLSVQTGYHLWCLYFYDERPLQYSEKIIDTCLATQNDLGGFGVQINSSACEDIDSIDPLVRLSLLTDYRKEDIQKSLDKALIWVLTNINSDGGWVFRRGRSFRYGHDVMISAPDESTMFPTWFRTLSLAYLSRVVSDSPISRLPWTFIKCPGHQFW